MPSYVCLYSVTFFDEMEKVEISDYGILQVEDMMDAIRQLEKVIYKDCLISVNYLQLFDTLPVIPEPIFNQLKDYFTEEAY